LIEQSERRSRPLLRLLRPLLALLTLATLALLLIAVVLPGLATAAVRWYLVGVAALSSLATLRAIGARFPTHRRPPNDPFAPRPKDSGAPPQRLREIERLVAYSRWSGSDYDERLRPILYDIARQRLAAYRSIVIETDPTAARALLGEQVWALIAPVPLKTLDRTITIAELESVIAALEGIGVTARH
jgi:hypothetical protein